MSKIIDITDKLNFEEKPQFKIKDVTVQANDDAVTMLKISAIYGEDINPKDFIEMFNLLFDEENQGKIESLKLDFGDFVTMITEITKNLLGSEDEGETPTLATT